MNTTPESSTPPAAPKAAPQAVPAANTKPQRPALAARIRGFLQNVQSKLPKKKAAAPAATTPAEKPQPVPVGTRVRDFLQNQLKRKKAPSAAATATTAADASTATTASETAAPPATESESKPKPPPMSARVRDFVQSHWNWKKALIAMAGGVVLIGVAAWQLLPDYLKEVAEEEGTTILGRKVTIAAIEWDPISMEFDLTGITIAGAPTKKGTAPPQLYIKKLHINAEWESLLRLEPVLENITVESPYVRITHRGKGAYDFDDILKNITKWQNAHPSQPDAQPTPLALYNIVIHDGAIELTDHLSTGEIQQHRLNKLELGIPFFSNIAIHRAVTVQPRLAFDLNGSHFETVATTTPTLSDTAKTSAHFKISQFDVARYAPYLPPSLPIRPHSAVIDADLRLKFDAVEPGLLESKIPSFTLSGIVNATGIALIDNRHQPALTLDRIGLDITEARPMEQTLKLQNLTLQSPTVYATRSKDGRINWDFAPKKGAANADAASASGNNAENKQKSWAIDIAQFDMQQGSVHWTDAAPAAQLSVERWDIKAQSVQWPLTATPIQIQTALQIPAHGGNPAGQLTVKGHVSQQKAHATIHLRDANLALGQPYLAALLEPQLYGLVDTDMEVDWSGIGLPKLSIGRGAVRHFALKSPHALPHDAKSADLAAHDFPSWDVLDITKGEIGLNDHSVSVGKVILRSPSFMVHRNAKKQWVALQWLKNKKLINPAPAPEAETGITVDSAVAAVSHSVSAVNAMVSGASAPARAPTPAKGGAWKIDVTQFHVEQGHVRFDDRAPSPRGVRFELTDLTLKANNFKPAGIEPMPLYVTARIKSSRALDKIEPGYIGYRGDVQWAPVAVKKAELNLQAVPMHVFAPYLANQINFSTERADVTYKGSLDFSLNPEGEMQLETKGDGSLDGWNLQTVNPKGSYEDLLNWSSLQLPGIDLRIAPNKPLQFRLARATLADFYARIAIDAEGKLNLQKLRKPSSNPDASNDTLADIALGPIQVLNGSVLFSDSYIQPNYSVNLSQLQGKISQFSSLPNKDGMIPLADISVSGKAENTALMEISGKINPLTTPLVMKVRGKVRDLDLVPLSQYVKKYANEGIENGKLNMDVEYEIQANGDLVANNRLVLKQLAFSEKKEESPTDLPIKLAMALLADRNGMINLDLPISGSLKDPDFQIADVLWKLFTSLITKALTAPFTLLSKAFGGDDGGSVAWSSVDFAAGSSVLSTTAIQALNQQIQALAARPDLSIAITGEANLEAEKNGFRQLQLNEMVQREKDRRAVRDDSLNNTPMTQDEYGALLRTLYRRSDMPKPRTWIGSAEKEMPLNEIKDALLNSIVVTENAMRDLALHRSAVVKAYLTDHKIAADRIFLQAPKTQNHEDGWKPRVQLGVRGGG